MIKYVHKSDIKFHTMTADVNTAGKVVSTHQDARRRLGDIAALSYVRARFFYSAPNMSGQVTIRLKAGDEVLLEKFMGFAGQYDVDIRSLYANTELYVELVCGGAGTDFDVESWLEIEHPLVIGQ